MPAKSAKQERFMQAVANNPKFAKAAGVPQSVGKEFTKSGGGMAKANPFMEMIAKKKAMAGKKPAKKMAAGGLAAGHKSADGIASKGKTKGKEVMMKKGGKC
jgi:hypothetical protein